MQLSRLAGNFLRTEYTSKLRRHFPNIDRMALQGLPMFVRQEIANVRKVRDCQVCFGLNGRNKRGVSY